MREVICNVGFDAVAPGQKASTAIPTDRRYFALMLKATVATGIAGQPGFVADDTSRAAIEAAIEDIELLYNGQVIRQHSAAQLLYINRINGLTNADGSDNPANPYGYRNALMLHFAAPWQATVQGEEINSLGTLGMNGDLRLNVKLSATCQNPRLELFLVFTYANRAPGRIMRQIRQSINVAQAGQYDLHTLRVGPTYSRIHFFSPNVNALEVNALARRPAVYSKANLPALVNPYGMGTEDAVFTAPFDFTQQLSDAFPTVTPSGAGIPDLNLKMEIGGTTGTSEAIQFISEIREEITL
jgi:hypothetical protein